MASLSFTSVLLLVINLVIISEIVCFPGQFLTNNIFSSSLNYVSKQFNSLQPQFNLQKVLIPETYTQNHIYTRPNSGRYNFLQNVPTAASTTKTNIEEFTPTSTTESNNDINDTRTSTIENKDIDDKWNSFFDGYFKNQFSTSESGLITTDNINNGEIPEMLKDILNETITETTIDPVTDATDSTLFDNETTTEDDLLRNGVPPELLSSLLG